MIIGDEILSGKFRDENGPFLVDRLRALARVFADFAQTSPTYYRLFVLRDESDVERAPSAEVCSALLAEPLDRLAAVRRVDPASLPRLKSTFWALIHGVVTLQVMRTEIAADAGLLEAALDGMIAGTVDTPARERAARVEAGAKQ